MENDFSDQCQELSEQIQTLSGELPGPLGGFHSTYRSALADGAISRKGKVLMALAISIVLRADTCMEMRLREALQAGASREELLETLGVAILMGGAPAVAYAATALADYDQVSSDASQKQTRSYGP